MGFLVVARSKEPTANAELMSGGVSYNHLKIAVQHQGNEDCHLCVVVYTNKKPETFTYENPNFVLETVTPKQPICVII